MSTFSLRAAAVAFGLVLVGTSGAAELVPLHPPAPFDRWCVKPVCVDAGAAAPPLTVPALLADDTVASDAEQELRAAIATRIEGWLQAYDSRPRRDLVRTVLHAILHHDNELEAAQGLGASLVRLGLTLRFEAAVAIDPACAGQARSDAVYEGLGVARALAALRFPEARRQVVAACKPTSLRVAAAVDGAMLRALDPSGDLRGAAKKLHDEVRAASAACGADPLAAGGTVAALRRASQAPTLASFLAVARAARAEKEATADVAGGCGQAMNGLAKLDLAPLSTNLARGLASMDLEALLDALSNDLLGCGGQCNAAKELLASVIRGVDASSIRAVLGELRKELGITSGTRSVVAAVLEALDAAVVATVGGAATLDGKTFTRVLREKACLDEDLGVSLACVLGAPAPLVLEANGGVPRLRSDDLRFVGDLTFGWKARSFGIIGRGALSYYDYATENGLTENLRAHGSIEAWYRSGDDDSKVRLDLRATGGGDYYDATYVPTASPSIAGYFHDEHSALARATLLAGVIVTPNARLFLNVLLGGGAQYESYGYLATDPRDPNVLSSTTSVTGRASGRLLLRWRFWPGVLSARLRVDGSWFRMTRDAFAVAQRGRPASAGTTSTQTSQVETSSRLFVDFDKASIFGFMPAAWGGVDYLQIESDDATTVVTVPVVGVGVVRPVF